MTVTIRPARVEDQRTIESLIYQAKINPRNLHWQNFLIAEDSGKIIGIRQVRIHAQGTREVGSGFVLPEYRHQGVSAQLMNEIFRREAGPLYSMIDEKWLPYYEQFGSRRVEPGQLPGDFRREYQIGRVITSLISLFMKEKLRIIPLKRD
jgi:amino-acid N-acetyltransferase